MCTMPPAIGRRLLAYCHMTSVGAQQCKGLAVVLLLLVHILDSTTRVSYLFPSLIDQALSRGPFTKQTLGAESSNK